MIAARSSSPPLAPGHAAAMEGLKRRLDGLADFIPRGRPVLYLDYPLHLNVGDMLINLGTEAWLAAHGYEVVGRACVHDATPRDWTRISQDTTVLLHGGGNFGDLYGVHQELRERVVADLPHNKIVVMPQSVHFRDAANLRRTASVLKRHRDLTITVRDHESRELLGPALGGMPIHMFPDMAHALWPLSAGRAAGGQGTLCLWRVDIEKVDYADQFGSQTGKPVDWEDMVTPAEMAAFKALLRWVRLDNRLGHRFPNHRLWYALRDRIVGRMVRTFAAHDAVTTNRLHAIILSCLLERPVTYTDNSYGKLSRYHAAWLEGCDVVRV